MFEKLQQNVAFQFLRKWGQMMGVNGFILLTVQGKLVKQHI